MKVFIAGGSGLLGSTLSKVMREQGHIVFSHSRTEGEFAADFLDRHEVDRVLTKTDPDVIVNLVCLSDVDKCDKDPNLAYRLNVVSLENITSWIKVRSNAHLVHISTDHLYDSPGENDEQRIIIRNVYAYSKLCSEWVAREVGGTVLRTNFFGPSLVKTRASFSDWLVEILRQGKPLTLFTDVFFSPLQMQTVSRMIDIVSRKRIPGVYNMGSHDGLSKRDFAYALARHLGMEYSDVRECSVDESRFSGRPKGMLMDTSRFERVFEVKLPTLISEIESLSYEKTFY